LHAIAFSDKRPIVLPMAVSVLQVAREMIEKNRFHGVLVDERSSPRGVISIRDIAKAIFIVGEEGIELVEAGSLGKILENPCHLYASYPPIVASSDISLEDAVELMVARNIGCLPLVDEESKLVGVLDERFLIKAIPEYARVGPCDIASWDVLWVEPFEEILASVGYMLSSGIRRLVVRLNGEYRLVSLVQVMKYVVEEGVLGRLLRGERAPLEEPVEKITVKPWVVECSYTLKEVSSIVAFEPTGAVLVFDREGNRGPGVLTERDLLVALYQELKSRER